MKNHGANQDIVFPEDISANTSNAGAAASRLVINEDPLGINNGTNTEQNNNTNGTGDKFMPRVSVHSQIIIILEHLVF